MENTPLHCLRAFQWTPAEHRERLVESAEQSLSWRLVATTLIDPTERLPFLSGIARSRILVLSSFVYSAFLRLCAPYSNCSLGRLG